MQCLGSKDPHAQAALLDAVLHAAWDAAVHVLVFPELAVDAPLLRRCQEWLGTHNLREQRLRLVVAGSRHCPERDGFANRCTVLGPLGDLLWEQDKHQYFAEWGETVLTALSPGRPIAELVEPTAAGSRITLGASDLGWLLTPICLDYAIADGLFGALGADLYLVPAMTGGLSSFEDKARRLGRSQRAASFVCNAQTAGERRCLGYLPVRDERQRPRQVGDLPLFILDAEIGV